MSNLHSSRKPSVAYQKLKVFRRRPASVVPDDILEHQALSDSARLGLAWMVGRPAGWELRIWHVCKSLGWTETHWATVRKQLIKAGYFRQKQLHGEAGHWVWSNEVTDTAWIFSDTPVAGISTTGAAGYGASIPGDQGDIALERFAQEEQQQEHNPPNSTFGAAAPNREKSRKTADMRHGILIWRQVGATTSEDDKTVDRIVAEFGVPAVETIALKMGMADPTGRPPLPRAVEAELRKQIANNRRVDMAAKAAAAKTKQEADGNQRTQLWDSLLAQYDALGEERRQAIIAMLFDEQPILEKGLARTGTVREKQIRVALGIFLADHPDLL